MVNKNRGFSGGLVTKKGKHGVFVYSGQGLKLDEQSAACDKIEFNIYPNPSSESFSVLLTSTGDEVSYLLVYDLQGRLMLKEKFSPNEIFLFGSDLTPGLYFAQIISGNEKHLARLIKQ
jgi:chondroitin-sulfate-ABC endolyase/exolyase